MVLIRGDGDAISSGTVVTLLLAALTVRCLTIMHPHSGMGQPPMYGDYEAQRHWMEVTTSLSVGEWYHNGTDNDLLYWGLDYPPLTAFHSWVVGSVGTWVIPEAFALHTSRGYEDDDGKLFMKMSVIAGDMLIYLPGALYAVTGVARKQGTGAGVLATLWLHPGLLLIDHGHFQYNSVCLGLALWAVGFVARHRWYLGSVCFTAAFFFKQIALYYAPSFFFTILALCFSQGPAAGVGNTVTTGLVVLTVAAAALYPFFDAGGVDGVLQVAHRVFPVGRGLFEDKVANFWCTSSLVWKAKEKFDPPTLLRMTTCATLAALLPGCAVTLVRKCYSNGPFVASLCIAASSFFMFSFHVHEKSVLFPIVMVTLLPAAVPPALAPHARHASLVANLVALFSMYPLVVKDGTQVLYASLFLLTVADIEAQPGVSTKAMWAWRAALLSLLAAHAIHGAFAPPERYPDLWTMLVTSLSFVYFAAGLGALSYLQLRGRFDVPYSRDME
eukprot:TRINITY_DN18609_c0_g1_i1.p1 TRINITY_DN18609_c0_g1~~TRINITY_DN18609_c0_g1_i1.p1  ORF type:complete len:499 (+),score=126.13 TRINITY_DN18609_c0_g1_i1:43-1539(+)